MTGELILFESHEVRAFEHDGEIWIPLPDLAEAWGIDRTTPIKIISRNSDVFEGLTSNGGVMSPDVQCVNERGLYLLMGKVSAGRLKHKEAREAIIRFQRWVPELIQKYRKKEIVQVPVSALSLIDEELDLAKHFAEKTQGNTKAFQAATLKKFGYDHLAEALDIPSRVHGEAGTWFTPTQIAERCGSDLSARNINYFLLNKGFQYLDGGLWRLSDTGKLHGEEYWFTSPQKHSEIRIRWKASILTASGLMKPIEQTALPAKV